MCSDSLCHVGYFTVSKFGTLFSYIFGAYKGTCLYIECKGIQKIEEVSCYLVKTICFINQPLMVFLTWKTTIVLKTINFEVNIVTISILKAWMFERFFILQICHFCICKLMKIQYVMLMSWWTICLHLIREQLSLSSTASSTRISPSNFMIEFNVIELEKLKTFYIWNILLKDIVCRNVSLSLVLWVVACSYAWEFELFEAVGRFTRFIDLDRRVNTLCDQELLLIFVRFYLWRANPIFLKIIPLLWQWVKWGNGTERLVYMCPREAHVAAQSKY